MQSTAKHLAGGSNQTHCTDWCSAAREMLRPCLMRRMLCMTGFYSIVISEQIYSDILSIPLDSQNVQDNKRSKKPPF